MQASVRGHYLPFLYSLLNKQFAIYGHLVNTSTRFTLDIKLRSRWFSWQIWLQVKYGTNLSGAPEAFFTKVK